MFDLQEVYQRSRKFPQACRLFAESELSKECIEEEQFHYLNFGVMNNDWCVHSIVFVTSENAIQDDTMPPSFVQTTSFSAHGSTANNLLPLVLVIFFGNEISESWNVSLKLMNNTHTTIDTASMRIITDQSKGCIAACDEVFKNTFHFNCSLHCYQNITKMCNGVAK